VLPLDNIFDLATSFGVLTRKNTDEPENDTDCDDTFLEDAPDDVLPCLFDLVKRVYGLAAETFLRHNVCFEFGQGASIDTSLALIHVRRVDLSRALSSQLFAATKKTKQAKKGGGGNRGGGGGGKKVSHHHHHAHKKGGNNKGSSTTGFCCRVPE